MLYMMILNINSLMIMIVIFIKTVIELPICFFIWLKILYIINATIRRRKIKNDKRN
jgi:hypothetical protein